MKAVELLNKLYTDGVTTPNNACEKFEDGKYYITEINGSFEEPSTNISCILFRWCEKTEKPIGLCWKSIFDGSVKMKMNQMAHRWEISEIGVFIPRFYREINVEIFDNIVGDLGTIYIEDKQ